MFSRISLSPLLGFFFFVDTLTETASGTQS